MIPIPSPTLIAVAVSGAIGFGSAWWIQGKSYGLEIESLKHQATQQQLDDANQAIADMAAFQKNLDVALANFQTTTQRNANAQKDLDRTLRDLRTTTGGMRSDFANLPERIAGAAKPALVKYANTCSAVLQELADRGGQLAERGGEIAKAADGHSADSRLLTESWPKRAAPVK